MQIPPHSFAIKMIKVRIQNVSKYIDSEDNKKISGMIRQTK